MDTMSTLYTVLGLPETATDEQIKQTYRMLAKRYHPDLHPGDAGVAKKFAEVNEAMETLGDPQKRKEYDNKRREAKKQAEQQAAAREAAAAAARARASAARATMASRPYVGTAQGAAAVVNDAYRKGYNEGFAAAGQQRNAAAETWKKSSENWQKEAEKSHGEIDILKAALEKARQRAADAEASARRMEASLSLQRNATEEAKRGIDAESASKEALRQSYESKLATEREARRYSDADKVRLSREVMRLKEENDALRARLGEAPAAVHATPEPPPIEHPAYESPAPEQPPVPPVTQTTYVPPANEAPIHAAVVDPAVIADLRERAESGDGAAAVTLSKMYLDGDGVHKDAAEGVRLLTLGVAAGNADALYHLGLCCLNGEGTDFDLNRGIQLVREAAEQGSEAAEQFLRDAEK